MFFPANLLASTAETRPNTTKANNHPEYKNTTTQNKQKITKARLGCLLWPPAWKRSRPILQLPGPQAAEHIMLTHCNDRGQLSW